MTLEFLTPSGSYTDAIHFSMNTPNVSGDITLMIESEYSKNYFAFDLTIVETNDRYTEFATDYTDELGDYDISGFYNYTLYQDSTPIMNGKLKLINNKDYSIQNEPKYVSPNENGESYVIYNP